jgi:hypothetical protein
MTTDINSIIIYALIAIIGFLIALVLKQKSRLDRIFRGKKGEDLEEVTLEMINTIKGQEREIGDIEKVLEHMEKRLRKSIQKVQTIRFNPFQDHGSNQSFTTAFLNEDGDGVILSGLHAREKMSVYAKPIKNLKSEYELSEEEKEALSS